MAPDPTDERLVLSVKGAAQTNAAARVMSPVPDLERLREAEAEARNDVLACDLAAMSGVEDSATTGALSGTRALASDAVARCPFL